MIFRGILKSRSRDINLIQKIVDAFVITSIFQINNENFSDLYNIYFLSSLIINISILNYNGLYQSYREKKISNIFLKIIFISFLCTFINLFFNTRVLLFQNKEVIIINLFIFIYLFFHHIILRFLLRFSRSYGFNSRELIFFGNKDAYNYMLRELKGNAWLGYKIKYWFSPNKSDYEKNKVKFETNNCLGGLKELKKLVISEDVDKIFFCHTHTDEISFQKIFKILGDLCIPVSYVLDWNKSYMTLEKEYIGDLMALNIWNPEKFSVNNQIKRIFDFSFSFIMILVLFPIFLFISIVIKLTSDGPIFFTQERYGLNGKVFKMYKFRTMFLNKEKLSKKVEQAKINDERVTKIGGFLRKYSLDEFPQLINVIRGEMSLVGPRPHAVEHNEYYRKKIVGYMQRHSRLPGMTGLAQISGARGETSKIDQMDLRINYDLNYNNNWNLFKDFKILIKTFFCILKGDAY